MSVVLAELFERVKVLEEKMKNNTPTFEVGVLKVEPGDVIVVRALKQALTPETISRLREGLQVMFPEAGILFTQPDCEIDIMKIRS